MHDVSYTKNYINILLLELFMKLMLYYKIFNPLNYDILKVDLFMKYIMIIYNLKCLLWIYNFDVT